MTGRSAAPLSRRRFLLAAAALGPGLAMARPGQAGETPHAAVVVMVDRAAAAIDRYGFPRALKETRARTWYHPLSGLYVFVLDRRGTLYLHPDSGMQGRNVLASEDADAKPFIRDIIAAAAAAAPDRGGWTDYVWPNPATGRLQTKHTYARLAGGYVVAAGYFAAPV